MAVYGSRDKNPFNVPNTYKINGVDTPSNIGNVRYYPLVDSSTGEVTIKSPTIAGAAGGSGLDRTIGTIPKDGVFKPVVGSTTSEETKYFSSAAGQGAVKNHAVITAQKAGAQNAQQLIFPNSATPGAGQGQNAPIPGVAPGAPGANQGQSTPSGTTPVDLGVKGTGKKSDFGDHRYPLDIDKIKQDKIKFSMLQYSPRGFSSFTRGSSETLGMLKDREGTDKRIIGTAYLPVPSGISEVNSAGWNGTPATPFELLNQNIALTTIQQGFGAGADVVGGVAKAAVSPSNNPDFGKAVSTVIAEAATNSGGLLSRTQGAIINPNLELLFNAPTLRPFNFTFKMSARSDKEAKEIIKIIRFFKQGMAPQKSESNLFIKAPHTFKIQYLLGSTNKDHPFIGQIKECALQNFVVNYTPEGQYATFYDGVLVSYEIQMTFSELEPVFNEDYGENFVNNLLFKE
jgi:hypothetical protein